MVIVLLTWIFLAVLFAVFLILLGCYYNIMNHTTQIRDGKTRWDGLPHYTFKKIGDFPKIKYRDFIKIYKINPEKYKLEEGYVKRNGDDKDIAFSFKFLGYYKYESLRKTKLKFEKKKARNEEEAEMLKNIIKEVEKDIEMHKSKSKESVEFAEKTIHDIMEVIKWF